MMGRVAAWFEQSVVKRARLIALFMIVGALLVSATIGFAFVQISSLTAELTEKQDIKQMVERVRFDTADFAQAATDLLHDDPVTEESAEIGRRSRAPSLI